MASRAPRFVVLVAAVLLAGAAGAQAGPWPPPSPPHQPARLADAPARRVGEAPPAEDDRGCDVLSYDLELRVDPSTRTLTGTVRIGYAPLAADLDTLHLDFVDALAVTAVTRGGAAAPYAHAGEHLDVALVPPPAVGAPDTVTVSWQGTPPAHGPFRAGLMFRTHDNGTLTDRSDDVPVIANVSQPWSAHAWWPCKDLPADKALVSVAVTAPDSFSVMGNGTLLAEAASEPGWRRWAWREAYPIAPYLVSIAVAPYASWREDCRPAVGVAVPLEFLVFPLDSLKAAHDFAPTCAMLEMMTDLAGPWPFPGEKYAQAEIVWIGAMEHQTATSFAQFLLTGTGRWENFVIHELAHQWFGDNLTPARWADIWLNEGFARYCEALWLERSRGPAAYRDYMQQIGPRSHPDLFTEDGLLGDPAPILPNLLIYDKGAWLLHSLRLLLGDRAFFAFLHDYATRPELAYGSVTRDDARAAAERAAGRDLTAFFAAWLETSAVPELAADWTVAPLPGGAARVALTLEQRQEQLVPVAVPVRIAWSGGVSAETAVLEGRRHTFAFTVPGAVREVAVDPDSLVLMRRAPAAPPPLAVTGPFPNPVGAAGARFTVTPAAAGAVEVLVYDARGRRLARHDLGDLPAGTATAWAWTPVDDRGRRLASGVVWCEFRAPAGRAVRRVLLLH